MSREFEQSLANLHLLTVLSETCSFTQTARRLKVSKASVSMRLNDLERALKVPLVQRTTRSVVLTAAGLQLVNSIESAFANIEQSVSEVQDLAGSPRGRVRLTAPVALGRQTIAPLLPAFLHQYPEIHLELELTDRLVNLAQEGFDLAIRHIQTPPETYVAWTLCASRSLLVASRGYLEKNGTPSHPSDLASHRCLAYLRDESTQRWTFEKTKGRKRPERINVSVSGPIKVNNSEVLREMVLGDLGIGLLPDFSALADLQAGSLIQVLSNWKPVGTFGGHLYAIRPWSARVPRAVQCIVEHLRENLAQGFEAGETLS